MKKIISVVMCIVICLTVSTNTYASGDDDNTTESGYQASNKIDLDSTEGTLFGDIFYNVAYNAAYALPYGVSDMVQNAATEIMRCFGYQTYDEELFNKMMNSNTSVDTSGVVISEELYNAIIQFLENYCVDSKVNLSDYIYKGYPDLANTTTYFPTALDYESTPNMSNPLAVSSWKYFLETYPNEMKLIMDTIKDCDYLWISFQSFYGTGSEDAQHPVYGMCISYIPQDYVERNAVIAVKNSGSGKHYSQKFYSYNKTYFNFSDVPMNYIIFMFDNYSPSISSRFCTLTGYDNVLTNQFVYVNDSNYYSGNVSYPVYNEMNAFMQWTYIYNDSSSYASASYYYYFFGRGRYYIFNSQTAYAELVANYPSLALDNSVLKNDDGRYTIYNYYNSTSDDNSGESSSSSSDYTSQLQEIIEQLKKINNKLLYSNILDTIEAVVDWVDELGDTATATAMGTLGETVQSAFPFSVVTDLVLITGLFVAEPVTPQFTIPIDFTSIKSDWYYEYTVDFSNFQTLADILKAFLLIMYISWLIMITPKFIDSVGGD